MLIQLIIAIVSAVVFSGLFTGYTADEPSIYQIELLPMLSFLLATLSTVVLGQLAGSNNSAKPAKKKSKAPKLQNSAPSTASDEDRELGSVKWFNVSKGFGFITRENDEDIFVHYRSIRGQGRRRLFEGQSVEFAVIDSDKGLQADDVEIL